MSHTGKKAVKQGKKKYNWKHYIPYYIMVLPGLIYLFFNNYMPMFGVVIAFKTLDFSKGIFGSPWCGFKNFKFLFGTKDAWTITRNTVGYNIAFFIVGTVLAITLAICLNEVLSKRASKVYQTVILLPYLMSWVIIGYLTYAYLSGETGLINKAIFQPLGIKPVSFYQETKYWPLILVLVNTWKGVGYSMIVYYSSLVGISADYYEAARIDGASKLEQIRYITLPLLKSTFITLFILSIGQMFRSDFGLFYQIPRNSGPLYAVTRTLDVYVYQALMLNSDYAMSAAAGLYQSVVGFILIVAANYAVRRYNKESAIF